jgi:hypothetical protein
VGSSIKNRENNRRLRRDWFDPLCTNVEKETSPDALVGIERKDPATFSSRLQSAPAKITLGCAEKLTVLSAHKKQGSRKRMGHNKAMQATHIETNRKRQKQSFKRERGR